MHLKSKEISNSIYFSCYKLLDVITIEMFDIGVEALYHLVTGYCSVLFLIVAVNEKL
jgi:hypothetical protein